MLVRVKLIFEYLFFCEFFSIGWILEGVVLFSGVDDWEIDSS